MYFSLSSSLECACLPACVELVRSPTHDALSPASSGGGSGSRGWEWVPDSLGWISAFFSEWFYKLFPEFLSFCFLSLIICLPMMFTQLETRDHNSIFLSSFPVAVIQSLRPMKITDLEDRDHNSVFLSSFSVAVIQSLLPMKGAK